MENKKKKNSDKDTWDKWDVILKPVGGLITAAMIGVLGFLTSSYLNRRQDVEMRTRLYTELINQREQSESALRKDMFKSIIDTFLRPGPQPPNLREKILNLELLAHNFHESLNLQPLFADLSQEVVDSKDGFKTEYLVRLERVARVIVMRQKGVLEAAGPKFDMRIDLKKLHPTKKPLRLENFRLTLNGMQRDFCISVLDADPATREIKVRLEIKTQLDTGIIEAVDPVFWVGFYDFPMINNTRLSRDQRCAITLNNYGKESAEITTLYFPGSHASLREKPYYEELIKELLVREEKGKKLVR